MHVHRLILLGALGCLVGCGFHSGEAKIDASPDVPDAPPDAASCVAWDALNLSPNVTPCDTVLGNSRELSLTDGSYVLDTDSRQLSVGVMTMQLPGAFISQASGSVMLSVVNVGPFTMTSGATVSIIGTHPLMFVVHGDAMLGGTIDVSARVNVGGASTAGPGADDAAECAGGLGADGQTPSNSSGAGGAGGGGYGDMGGDGGDGNGGGHGAHGMHGSQTGNSMLVPLRGGCRGGKGGATGGSNPGGRAGNGGGAVEVTALGMIDVSGTIISAGSGGGAPALGNAGGGAGGSGGAILFDGNIVNVEASGKLCANGGGGGAGGILGLMSTLSANGTCSTMAASGGTSAGAGATGGNGGDGGASGMPAGKASDSTGGNGGGGGGGGSVGRIRVRGRTTRTIDPSAIVSPAAAM